MVQRKFSIGIREKLFFLILVAFTALILTTFWQVGEKAQRVSGETINLSLQQSNVVLDTKIESRFNFIQEVATSISRDGRILPLIYEKETLTLQDQSTEFQQQLDFNILYFTDASGTVLARSDRPEAIGQNMAGKTAFFDKALSGESAQGYFLSQGRLMQIVAVPVFDNVIPNLVRGTVALAYEFSDAMADEILSLTSSEISFFSFTRNKSREVDGVKLIYFTKANLTDALYQYFSSEETQWKSVLSNDVALQNVRMMLGDEEFYAIVKRVGNENSDPLGFIVVLRSSSELLRPFTEIQNSILVTGGACLLAVFLFAWLMSRRISRPILELASLAGDIQEGKYPEKNVAPKSRDEVGLLYRAVLQMGNALKEKAELENYLAQMSDELHIDDSLIEDTVSADIQVTVEEDDKPIEDFTTIDDTAPSCFSVPNVAKSIRASTLIDGRYEVRQLIGEGAMGSVFLAQDTELDECVAIKMLSQELFSLNASVNFKEEIRLARLITHRNILRTFDFGSWDKFFYITMEYVSGYDLNQLLKSKGAQSTHIALIMVRQICSAINAAHEQGIIHLDLKPANMMINRQGILKIMDFGLAQRVATDEGGVLGQDASTALAGTPRYMAPEQFLKNALDERTDIYSVGIILYTLISGKPPFSSDDMLKLAEMHIHHDLPPLKVAGVPRALEKIIDKATAKDPSDRFQSIREMLDQLNAL